MIGFLSIKKEVEQAKTSPQAFERLYNTYMPKTYAFIASRTSNIQEAEDITSDVWLKILQKLNSFNPEHENSFLAWIFTITRNQLIDYYRVNSKTNSQTIVLDEELENSLTNNFNIINQIDNQLERQKLKTILKELPPKQSESINLKYFCGFKNKEIATLQEISEKTVASNLTRALTKIKDFYNLQ